jgi:hypothetical protein
VIDDAADGVGNHVFAAVGDGDADDHGSVECKRKRTRGSTHF